MADLDPRATQVLDLWFPDSGHWNSAQAHLNFWDERMQGGMDNVICSEFADLTQAGARGELDAWAETPRGRMALILVLDQFPRSLWRDTPGAFGQDIKACRLCLEGIGNGHYQSLPVPWERMFYVISIGHCEGPDHLERMDLCIRLVDEMEPIWPEALAPLADGANGQNKTVRGVIERFGRHPHRNAVLGRTSTAAEEVYIAAGEFPHQRKASDTVGST
ncbi:DUF924 family protein [Ruegeria arenilitoris]|uniref:DUF924 family protein n=1 Tax=Ruegeria arenilitoris TaxID=1173585 RepID=UPI00147AE5A6|nr:DUF924 family protein [Ruegeria arenilitoris]